MSRKRQHPAYAIEMRDHLEEAIFRLGADAFVTLDAPAKLTKNARPVAIHVDTLGNEASGGVFAWRTIERTEGELPNKLIVETIDDEMVEGWREQADAWIAELAAVQKRDDDLVAQGFDPKKPPAWSLTVHRLVHDMLEADGRGGLIDPGLVMANGGYSMPGLVREDGQSAGGSLFVIDMRPMGGRLEARKVGTKDFWFEQKDGECLVVVAYGRNAPRPLPDTMVGGLGGTDLADVIAHPAIAHGQYAVRSAEIIETSEGPRFEIAIGDQQVPLLRS